MKRLLALLGLGLLSCYCYGQTYLLYGATVKGGVNNEGVIFSYNPLTYKYNLAYSFNGTNGAYPEYDLIQASNGLLYGIATGGGKYNNGVLFSFDIYSGIETDLVDFNDTNGNPIKGGNFLLQGKDGLLYGTIIQGGTLNYGVLFQYDINANKESVLYNFDGSLHGWLPGTGLAQDTNTGLLYGFTEEGGSKKLGTLFNFNPLTNKDSVLIVFDSANGSAPLSTPILINNELYGITGAGGKYNYGVIFRYNLLSGQETVLNNFNDTNGREPVGEELLMANNGLFYGMTYAGGGPKEEGVCFSFDTSTDKESILFNFTGPNGASPEGGMIQYPLNGLLYSIASFGGDSNYGLMYSYNILTNKDSVLKSFTGIDGNRPSGSLLLVKDTSTVGINEIIAKNESISVYPNPSKGLFNFRVSNYVQGVKNRIVVYNILGDKVYQQLITNNTVFTINLADQPNGVYLYRFVSENGSLVSSGKLIIQ